MNKGDGMNVPKLSDAIRVGAKMRPPSERGWNDVGPDGNYRSCAIMAAAEAAGLFTIVGSVAMKGPNYRPPALNNQQPARDDRPVGLAARLSDEWSLVLSRMAPAPCRCAKTEALWESSQVLLIVWHLHDIHKWSREAVAEWIGVIENEIEAEIARTEARRIALLKDLEA